MSLMNCLYTSHEDLLEYAQHLLMPHHFFQLLFPLALEFEAILLIDYAFKL